MKPPQFFTTLILSSICVLLSLLTFWQGQALTKASADFEAKKNGIQSTIQADQTKINTGNQLQQVLFRMVQEIMNVATDGKGGTKDEKLKAVVDNAGIKINLPPASTSPTPATH